MESLPELPVVLRLLAPAWGVLPAGARAFRDQSHLSSRECEQDAAVLWSAAAGPALGKEED